MSINSDNEYITAEGIKLVPAPIKDKYNLCNGCACRYSVEDCTNVNCVASDRDDGKDVIWVAVGKA